MEPLKTISRRRLGSGSPVSQAGGLFYASSVVFVYHCYDNVRSILQHDHLLLGEIAAVCLREKQKLDNIYVVLGIYLTRDPARVCLRGSEMTAHL